MVFTYTLQNEFEVMGVCIGRKEVKAEKEARCSEVWVAGDQ